jgi:amidophosphoribosyltransferase
MEIELDKLHEECGVVAVYGNPESAKLCYLGLHALQHRGQESAGIAASNGRRLTVYKSMGLVADIFGEAALQKLPGNHAIGHTRYSTAGDSALLNAQPILVDCNKGQIAIAHNGNIVNAADVRKRFERNGSIFQTSSDTEIVLHLIAQSHEKTLPDAMADALRRIEGAFSFVHGDCRSHLRRPRSARLPSSRRWERSRAKTALPDSVVFASETCAFDLLGADYIRDVKPGELVVVGPEGVHSHFYAPALAQSQCIFEQVYFARPDSLVFGKSVQEVPRTDGPAARA